MEELLGVRLWVVHNAHCRHIVHDLVVGRPEQVVAGVELTSVAVHKLQLEARLSTRQAIRGS